MTHEGWTHGEAFVNGVRLHFVEAGPVDGPLALLLHGFPEFWWAWRHQIGPLARAGFRVVAPDLRGYNTSEKPNGIRNYTLDLLVQDVAELIGHFGRQRAHVVGHDWGGIIAWALAMRRPEFVERLVVLNAPHPQAYRRELPRLRQPLRSWYALFFQLPWLPEALLSRLDVGALLQGSAARPDAFSEEDLDAYRAVWQRPGAWTPALNYYRALARTGFGRARPIEAPTLLLWGEQDLALVPELANDLETWVPNIRRERFARAGHWLMRDEPVRVNNALVEFLSGAVLERDCS